jgi:hypothetical protein
VWRDEDPGVVERVVATMGQVVQLCEFVHFEILFRVSGDIRSGPLHSLLRFIYSNKAVEATEYGSTQSIGSS